jgi:hypothetical protein
LSQFAIHLDEAKALSKLTIQQNPSKSQKCETEKTEKDAPLQMHQSLLCQILQRSQKWKKTKKCFLSFLSHSKLCYPVCQLTIQRKNLLKRKKTSILG